MPILLMGKTEVQEKEGGAHGHTDHGNRWNEAANHICPGLVEGAPSLNLGSALTCCVSLGKSLLLSGFQDLMVLFLLSTDRV